MGCSVTAEDFLSWDPKATQQIRFQLMDPKDAVNGEDPASQTRHIPEGYCRIVHQFICEVQLGKDCHAYEAERRMIYASRVTDEFIEEIKPFDRDGPGANWRSKVLTPILQRQLVGISDVYSWSVNRGVMAAGYEPKDPPVPEAAEDNEEFTDDTDDDLDEDREYSTEEITARRRQLRPRPTILHATRTYLEFDPLEDQKKMSEMYRRNLIYIREMRWHLGVVSNHTPHKSTHVSFFQLTLQNQDYLQECLSNSAIRGDLPGMLLLQEALVIVVEEHQRFFWPELSGMVRRNPSLISDSRTSLCHVIVQ